MCLRMHMCQENRTERKQTRLPVDNMFALLVLRPGVPMGAHPALRIRMTGTSAHIAS